jgi:hypothetical protein
MRPLRRTILQFSQMRLTLERTFMTGGSVPRLACSRADLLPPKTLPAASDSSIGRSIQIGTARQPARPIPGSIAPELTDTLSGPGCPRTESSDYMSKTNETTSKAAPEIVRSSATGGIEAGFGLRQ